MIVLILRSVAGAGKSTLSSFLKENMKCETEICCADDFFEKDGKYVFNPDELSINHSLCKHKFLVAIEKRVPLVIVANTNVKERDFKHYECHAKENGYTVISLVVENRHGNKNIHGVPDSTLEKQKNSILNSLKLIP